MVSPSIEVLIYIEHNGEVKASELKHWRETSLRGVIGKLEAQSLILRKKSSSEVIYRLSDAGVEYLDRFLESLHKTTPVSSKWSFVFFSIPEKKRTVRDRLRRFLRQAGYGHLFGAIWVAPSQPNLARQVMTYAKSLKVSNNVQVIEGVSQKESDQDIVAAVWDLGKIANRYRAFIKKAKEKIKTIKGDAEPKYETKKLIFELAMIMYDDPNLPTTALPHDWPRDEALEVYKEIRKKIN